MSDAEWDDDNFEAPTGKAVVSDKSEGEDEDEEVRENWDAEDEQEKKDEGATVEASAVQIKKKKPLKDRLADREDKRKKELEEKRKQDEEVQKLLTPKQLYEEQIRRQKLQEAADLELAVEAFGFKKEEPLAFGVIDGFDPKTKDEFDKFSQMLSEKITKFDKSPYYVPLLENLVRDLTLSVGAEDLKKVSSTLNTLYNETVKLIEEEEARKACAGSSIVEDEKEVGETGIAVGTGQLKLVVGDGRKGYDSLAPYDAIHVGAAAPEIPQANLNRSLSRAFIRCRSAGSWTTTTSATGMPSLESDLLHRTKNWAVTDERSSDAQLSGEMLPIDRCSSSECESEAVEGGRPVHNDDAMVNRINEGGKQEEGVEVLDNPTQLFEDKVGEQTLQDPAYVEQSEESLGLHFPMKRASSEMSDMPKSKAKKRRLSAMTYIEPAFTGEPANIDQKNFIVFIDTDNWYKYIDDLLQVVSDKGLLWFFHGGALRWMEPTSREYIMAKQRGSVCIARRSGTRKDSTDFSICYHVGRMDMKLPIDVPFAVLSGDKGFGELENQCQDRKRRICVISPHMIDCTTLSVLLSSVVNV